MPDGTRHTERMRAIEALPPLPAVALRVIQVAQDPRSSASDLALVVSSDPGLSARLLRIANSAAYRRTREVTSVQEALVVLGFVQARNVAISSAITSAYAPDSLNALFRISEFWRHSIAVAFKASEMAAQSKRLDVPSAFTAGIIHNMGRLAMFHADPAGVDQAVARALANGLSLEEAEEQQLAYDHAELGEALTRRWNLPEEIAAAVGHHHDAELAAESLASVVARADQYCVDHHLLPGYVAPETAGSARVLPADAQRLFRQVDTLMEMVSGEPVGVSGPAA